MINPNLVGRGLGSQRQVNSNNSRTRRVHYHNIRQGGHIDQGDIKSDQEFVEESQAKRLSHYKNISNRSSANQLLRMATSRLDDKAGSSGAASMRKSFRSPYPTGRQDQLNSTQNSKVSSQHSSIEHAQLEPNPFYMKTIKRVVAT